MPIEPNVNGGAGPARQETLCQRIATDLRSSIERGEYPPGHRLPSGRALMRQYRVARQTVQNAFDLLRGEGMIVTRPGAGAFVRTRPAVQHLTRNRLERSGRRTLLDGTPTQGPAVPARTEPADEHTANILGVRLGAEILVRERVLHADGEPIQLATSRLRPAAAGQARDHFVEYVSTRPARPEEATSLMLSSGTPVLCVTRIAFDNEGTAVELNDMVLPGDRYQLIYEIPAD